MACDVPLVTLTCSLRITASLQGRAPRVLTIAVQPAHRPIHAPLPNRPELLHKPVMAEGWSLDGHQDFAVVKFIEIVPGLLHCCLVHKNYVSALPTSNFANQCQV